MIYTNVKGVKGKNIKQVKLKDMISLVKKSKLLFLDTETYAKDFDREQMVEIFIAQHIADGKKVTATTKKSALKHADDYRLECGLDPFRSGVRLLQIKTDKGDTIVADSFVEKLEPIIKVINNKPVIGQNLKFDIKVLRANYDYQPGEIWDTMIAYKIDRARHIVGFFRLNLQNVVRYYTGITLEKGFGASDWNAETISAEQFEYVVLDVKYLPDVFEKQISNIEKDSVHRVSTGRYFLGKVSDAVTIIEMKFVEVLADIELTGIPMNKVALDYRRGELEKSLKRLIKPFEKDGLNTNSPAQIIKYLDKKGIDVESASRPILLHHVEHKVVDQLLQVRNLQKEIQMLYDYAHTYPKENGRIYSDYWQIRSHTGRMSSTKPNMQQIPRTVKDLIYLSTKKQTVLKADYPQIEMRILSIKANDQKMKDLFIYKKDPHVATAADILKKDPKDIDDGERFRGKICNFGFLYGMGLKRFIEFAYAQFNITYTLEQAGEFKTGFMRVYKGVKRLHDSHANQLAQHPTIVVQTLLGRQMMVENYTNANNNPIQGSGADMIKLASNLFYSWCKRDKVNAHICNPVHDELVVVCDAKQKKVAGKLLKKAMETAADYIIQEFKTEVKVEEVEIQTKSKVETKTDYRTQKRIIN